MTFILIGQPSFLKPSFTKRLNGLTFLTGNTHSPEGLIKQVSRRADLYNKVSLNVQISNKLLEDLKKLHDLAQLIPVEKYNFKKLVQ